MIPPAPGRMMSTSPSDEEVKGRRRPPIGTLEDVTMLALAGMVDAVSLKRAFGT